MKQSLSYIAAALAVCFALGALAGHAQAEEPSLQITPQSNDELALPAEPIPADPDEDMPMIYNLVEPSETLSDVLIIYAV